MPEKTRERRKVSPYPDKKDEPVINDIWEDEVVEPKDTPRQPRKKRVYLEIIIDGTYSMSKIYYFVYHRLTEEADALSAINADIFIKTIIAHDNNSRSAGDFGSIGQLKTDLLSAEFYGGNYDGYEPCLNDALFSAVADLGGIDDADLKGIVLVTDSMPGESRNPAYPAGDNMCDFALLFVGEPGQDGQFIGINGESTRDIRAFLGNDGEKILYSEIDRKLKAMERDIW